MSAIAISGDRIAVTYTSAASWESLAAVPGARWNRLQRVWFYPATATVAQQLVEVLPTATLDPRVERLVEQAAVATAAQAHKEADNLEPIPLTLTVPWRHQLRAYHFAKDMPAAMLALEMGTGKSKVVVDLAVNLGLERVLIICPLSVVDVWPEQFRRHAAAPFRVLTLGGSQSVKEKAALLKQHDEYGVGPLAVVVNYESAWREPLAAALLGRRWPLAVLDESHRIKAAGGKASLFCARLRDRAMKRLCLTGTPMPHSPLDLYAQYRFLDPGIFGTSVTRFRARYAVMGGYQNKQVVAWQRQEEMTRKFYELAYRVEAGEVLDLPPATDMTRPFRLSAAEARVYAQIESEMVAEVRAGTVTAANALVKLLRLSQITSGFVRTDDGDDEQVGTSKRAALADVLEDLPKDEPVVVFGLFHCDLDTIKQAAEESGRRCLELSGRRNELKRWQDGEAQVLAVQTQSGGVGIDLTRARYCVYYSQTWSLGDYEQSRARVHRPGQERPVVYVHLVAAGTVDETKYRALESKEDAVQAVLRRMQ